MIYTPELIKSIAPSVFATQPSEKLSNKYVFVPTDEIIESFLKEGWKISEVKQNGKGVHGVHQIKFRNGELPKVGDTLFEAVVRNSHNGMSKLSVSAGLFRLCCSNGLTVPTALSESFNLRHSRFDLDEVKQLTESFAGRLPKIETSVHRMMERKLSTDEKIDFLRKSAEVRFGKDKVLKEMEIVGLLTPNRMEDEGDDMWRVFNVVQEKFVRGGVEMTSQNGRRTRLRGLQNIMAVNQINTKLWDLAEEMM